MIAKTSKSMIVCLRMLASKVFQISYLIGAARIPSVQMAMKAYFAANVPPI
jgi:hypothetical protein